MKELIGSSHPCVERAICWPAHALAVFGSGVRTSTTQSAVSEPGPGGGEHGRR